MTAELLVRVGTKIHRSSKYLLAKTLPEGGEPESRIVVCGVSWQRYLEFDKALGDDRPGPRFYYLDGELEIVTLSNEHERVKKWLGGFMDLYFDQSEVTITTRGSATIRLALKQAGAEPDDSWCLETEKEYPDLVLEIALTSGGIKKLELYRRFGVREVWFWRKGRLEVFALLADAGGYEKLQVGSRLLPGLDTALLERCATIPDWRDARLAFRAGLAAKGE